MPLSAFTRFETPIGRCSIVWAGSRLIGTQLPEASESDALRLLDRRFPGATDSPPPEFVRSAIAGMQALLKGEPNDLDRVELDLTELGDFSCRVLQATRAIPSGATATYGEIARQIGAEGEARAVGQALGRNPFPVIIPCHRVLGANGKVGGFSANGGVATKLKILTIERALTSATPSLFDNGDWPLRARP